MPPTQMILTADHITYSVDRLPTEYTNIRLWALHKQCPTNEAEYYSASSLALYWYYHHTLGCEYNAAIERKIASIDR